MKKTDFIIYFILLLTISCQVNSVEEAVIIPKVQTLDELLNTVECNRNDIYFCDTCTLIREYLHFEKQNGLIKNDTLLKSGNEYIKLTPEQWEIFEYKEYYKPSYFYYRKKIGDFNITNEYDMYSQVLTYELDTTISRYKNKTIEELQVIVKEKMLSLIKCMKNEKSIMHKSSLYIFEGFVYRNGKKEITYKLEDWEYDNCAIEKLHYCEVYLGNSKLTYNFIFDDIPEKNRNGEFGSVLKFIVEID